MLNQAITSAITRNVCLPTKSIFFTASTRIGRQGTTTMTVRCTCLPTRGKTRSLCTSTKPKASSVQSRLVLPKWLVDRLQEVVVFQAIRRQPALLKLSTLICVTTRLGLNSTRALIRIRARKNTVVEEIEVRWRYITSNLSKLSDHFQGHTSQRELS